MAQVATVWGGDVGDPRFKLQHAQKKITYKMKKEKKNLLVLSCKSSLWHTWMDHWKARFSCFSQRWVPSDLQKNLIVIFFPFLSFRVLTCVSFNRNFGPFCSYIFPLVFSSIVDCTFFDHTYKTLVTIKWLCNANCFWRVVCPLIPSLVVTSNCQFLNTCRFGWFVYCKIFGRCRSQAYIVGSKRCFRWKGLWDALFLPLFLIFSH